MRKHRCIGLAMGLMAVIGTAQAEPLTTAGVGLASCEKLARDLKPEQGFTCPMRSSTTGFRAT